MKDLFFFYCNKSNNQECGIFGRIFSGHLTNVFTGGGGGGGGGGVQPHFFHVNFGQNLVVVDKNGRIFKHWVVCSLHNYSFTVVTINFL